MIKVYRYEFQVCDFLRLGDLSSLTLEGIVNPPKNDLNPPKMTFVFLQNTKECC